MKKNRLLCYPAQAWIAKLLRVMKLTVFLMLVLVFDISASVFSQNSKISVKIENGSLSEIFARIEEQTDYRFFYQNEQIKNLEKKSISVENENIVNLIGNLLENTGLTFKQVDRNIIIYPTTDKSGKNFEQQTINVTGKVTDSSGSPLPGVTVVVKGTTQGIITDGSGEYYLTNVPSEATIIFSFVGMKTQEVLIDGKNRINIILQDETIGLEEVVAIGYGTMKKSDLTGSVTSVSSDDLAAFPAQGINQAIQGRATGVQITSKNGEPGAGTRIRIRGGTSLNASSDPLYVVDGFAGGAVPPPEDINSIEILKDASATAIYGSRGANGVILITTKSGKSGETVIEFNSTYSFDHVANKLDLLNASEFATYLNEVYANSGSSIVPYSNPSALGKGTDWQDVIFRNGNLQNYQLSASGGKDSFKFYTSVNYFGQEGIVINSDYKRYSGLSNLDYQAGKNLKMGTRMFFQRSIQNGIKSQEGSGGTNNTGVIAGALIMEPTTGIYKEDGTYTLSTVGDPNDNPYAVATEYTNESVNDLFQGNIYMDLKIIEGLVFKSTFGVKVDNNRNGTYSPTTLNAGRNVGGQAAISAIKRTSVLNENYLSYNKTFNEIHKLNFMAGYSYQYYTNESWSAANNKFITDTYLYWNLDGGADYQKPYSQLTEWKMASFYGRANYNLADKYLLTFTGRYDGSSRFGANNKWAFFPSGAFAWNVKQEPFMQDIDMLSHLKLRASYGATGNTDIGIYQSLANFASTSAVINEQTVNAVIPSTVANSDLSWESTKQTDIGLDIGFADERISLTADYYYMRTDDLLYAVPLPEYSGYGTSLRNIGSIENKGLEFGLNTVNSKGRLNWTSDFNISFNRNKVLSLPGGELKYSRRPGHLIGDDTHILTEGSPAGSFYGYIYDGVDDKGAPVYRDIASRDTDNNLVMEPNGVVNGDDRTIIGNPHPDFIFGFNNSLKYKNFDLNIFFQGVVGNDMLNFTRMELEWVNGKGNQMASVLNRWSPTNTNTDIPKASGSYSSISSSRWIEDGTYIRLKNLSLGYNVPEKVLKNVGVEKLRIYVSGQNLWTQTKYTGYNPDVSYSDGNTSLGLDYGSYPNTKSFTIGLNLSF